MNHYGAIHSLCITVDFFFCGPHKEIIMLYDNYMFLYGRSSTNHLAPVLKCAVIKGNNTSYQTPLPDSYMFSWCLVGWSFIYAAGSGFLVVLRAIQMSKSQCDWRPSCIWCRAGC